MDIEWNKNSLHATSDPKKKIINKYKGRSSGYSLYMPLYIRTIFLGLEITPFFIKADTKGNSCQSLPGRKSSEPMKIYVELNQI